jgi:hypothetical protein
MNFLSGKKTYIVAFGVVTSAVVAFLTGEMTLAQAVVTGLEGTGLAALRAGVASSK